MTAKTTTPNPYLGLDKALLRSRTPQSPTEQPGNQQTSKQVSKETSLLGNQEASKPGSKVPGLQGTPEPRSSEYRKATYKLSQDTLDAIEDAKRILRRQYGVRQATLDRIAEEAITAAYADLLKNKETSLLVNKFAGNPANQETS